MESRGSRHVVPQSDSRRKETVLEYRVSGIRHYETDNLSTARQFKIYTSVDVH